MKKTILLLLFINASFHVFQSYFEKTTINFSIEIEDEDEKSEKEDATDEKEDIFCEKLRINYFSNNAITFIKVTNILAMVKAGYSPLFSPPPDTNSFVI